MKVIHTLRVECNIAGRTEKQLRVHPTIILFAHQIMVGEPLTMTPALQTQLSTTTSVDIIVSQTGYNCEITLFVLVNLAINVNRAITI